MPRTQKPRTTWGVTGWVTTKTTAGTRTVPATIRNGLAVHRSVDMPASVDAWTVTAAASGRAVSKPLRTRKLALAYADALLALWDGWETCRAKGDMPTDVARFAQALFHNTPLRDRAKGS